MRDYLYIYMKEARVHVLGPGSRYVLWVQGCSKKCPGCVAESAKDMMSGRKIKINALAAEIFLSRCDGITISGGEPFLQAQELAEMLTAVKKKKDMGVIVYTGYRYEELLNEEKNKSLIEHTDLLIDGTYIQEKNDSIGLRGSSNQRFLFLTERYRKEEKTFYLCKRKKEVFKHGIIDHIIGIPEKNSE